MSCTLFDSVISIASYFIIITFTYIFSVFLVSKGFVGNNNVKLKYSSKTKNTINSIYFAFVICGLYAFILFFHKSSRFLNEEEKKEIENNEICNFEKKKNKFNILVLPLKRYDFCENHQSCDIALVDGINSVTDINVNVSYCNEMASVNIYDKTYIDSVLKKSDYDLIVYGGYEKIRCDWDTTKFILRYEFAEQKSDLHISKEKSKFKSTLLDIASGDMVGDIKDLVSYSIGLVEFGNNNFTNAKKYFNQVNINTSKKEYKDLLVFLGICNLYEGNTKNVIELFESAYKLDTTDQRMLINLLHSYSLSGDYKMFQRHIGLVNYDDLNDVSIGQLGLSYNNLGMIQTGEELLLKSHSLNDKNYQTNRILANLYISKHQYENALYYLNKSIEDIKQSRGEMAIVNNADLARCYFNVFKYDKALEYSLKTHSLYPYHYDNNWILGFLNVVRSELKRNNIDYGLEKILALYYEKNKLTVYVDGPDSLIIDVGTTTIDDLVVNFINEKL